MKRVLVIGGGFAGLSAAAYLSKYGFKVKVFESSPKLGGRAYSFKDDNTGDIIDNGQHIMMGCYTETINFLQLTGNINNILIQKKLRVTFSKKGNEIYLLRACTGLYPMNLLLGILNFKAVSLKERIGIIKFFMRLYFLNQNKLNGLTVKQFLEKDGQSDNSIKSLWEILSVGALNTSTSKASALMFARVLKHIFFRGSKHSSIIIPKTGLSDMYCNGAENYIREKGGDICLSSRIENIRIENNLAVAVIVNGYPYNDFDYIISAVPFFAVNKFADDLIGTEHFIPSSILSMHIWLNSNPFSEEFYGLIDSEVHWIFNHGSYLTIVISDADKFMILSKDDIFRIVVSEIKEYFSFFSEEMIRSYRIIKEKRATFIPDNSVIYSRPGTMTPVSNLFLAGDWINTGLPATIESAVKSGRLAAEAVLAAQEH